ncbi:helicase associated domain-containing protein [Streptomyces sp. NPDC001135]
MSQRPPQGQWIADARRFHACGDMDADRIEQLQKLGMIWSHYDVAWEEGLAPRAGGPRRTGTCSRRWTPPTRATR